MAKKNQKLFRLRQEKEKLMQKCSELQAQIILIDDEIQKQENLEIIDVVRANSVSLDDLKVILGRAAQSPLPQNSPTAPRSGAEQAHQVTQREEEQEQ